MCTAKSPFFAVATKMAIERNLKVLIVSAAYNDSTIQLTSYSLLFYISLVIFLSIFSSNPLHNSLTIYTMFSLYYF